MGYNVKRFTGAIDDNLLCSICSQVLEEAVLTPCGHSFCLLCLETWLARPGCCSCPQCRDTVFPGQAKPIHSLRNFISSLTINCDYKHRGCRVLTTMENIGSHLELCIHGPVQCAGCDETVSRSELPDHQIRCRAIAALLDDKVTTSGFRTSTQRPPLLRSSSQPSQDAPSRTAMFDLSTRVSGLEIQLNRMKDDLRQADERNQQLGQDLQRARRELEERHREHLERTQCAWDVDYNYGYTADSITKLSFLLLRYRQKKPSHVDVNEVFDCVHRCYNNFGHNRNRDRPADPQDEVEGRDDEEGEEKEQQEVDEVHMLVAVAQACVWFSDTHRLNFHCWLQSIARHRQYHFIQNHL